MVLNDNVVGKERLPTMGYDHLTCIYTRMSDEL